MSASWAPGPFTRSPGARRSVSLFYFNLDSQYDVWAIYYFAYFFLGVLAFASSQDRAQRRELNGYFLAIAGALVYAWRWRLLVGALTGLLLHAADRTGLIATWPKSRIVAYLGRTSYSLFLVHYPTLLLVEVLWSRLDWATTSGSLCGLFVAYGASLGVADIFYRYVERPAARVSRAVTAQSAA